MSVKGSSEQNVSFYDLVAAQLHCSVAKWSLLIVDILPGIPDLQSYTLCKLHFYIF